MVGAAAQAGRLGAQIGKWRACKYSRPAAPVRTSRPSLPATMLKLRVRMLRARRKSAQSGREVAEGARCPQARGAPKR